MNKKRPTEICVCERAKLFCEQCNHEVYGIYITQEWHDHCGRHKYIKNEDYKRKYECPYCHAYVGCYKGTSEPLQNRIPTDAVRKGRAMTYDLVVAIGEEFKLKRKEVGECLGFSNYKDIKVCESIEQLRDAYKLGIRLREELRK